MLLKVLEDGNPHTQFGILEEIKNRFYNPEADLSFWSVAARAWDLVKPKGKYKLNIKSGPPAKFGKKRIGSEHYYQLIKPEDERSQTFTDVGSSIIYDLPDNKLREKIRATKKPTSPFAFNVKGQGELFA